MELKDFIGETTHYDKKQQLEIRKPKSWLKSISAFSNGQGGKLIFGIADDDRVIGLSNYQKDSEDISELIKVKLDPIPEFELDIKQIDGKFVIIVTIFSGRTTPYYLVDGGSRTAYIRVGNESVPANSVQLTQLALKGQQKSYDELTIEHLAKNASFSKLRSLYYSQTRQEFRDSDLESFGLVAQSGHLTRAGALLADEPLVRQSRIFCTRWNGLTKANGRMDALDDVEIEGSLLIQLQEAESFIRRNSKKKWLKKGTHRVEFPDYPERAVTEALVNAIIHRDYMILGSEVHVDMFDDRLEIYSPGGMPDGSLIQEKSLENLSSKRRNPIIADVFSRMDLMERRGSGLRKILDSYTSSDNYSEEYLPKFQSSDHDFRVILTNLNFEEGNVAIKRGDNVAIKRGDNVAITNREAEILAIASRNETFKTKDIEEELGIKSTRARKLISQLVSKGLIEAIGQNRSRYYRLIEK